MHRSIKLVLCVLVLLSSACGDDDGGGGGASGTGVAGTGVAGTGAAGTGTAGTGTAGTMAAAEANMPDATCLAAAGTADPTCSNCACTPTAIGGCLDQLNACEMGPDAMANMLCGAIIDCARANGCSGPACSTPCSAQITPALMYMGGAPLTAAQAVGNCTTMNCPTSCM